MIIGFVGRAGSGKDAAAKGLIEPPEFVTGKFGLRGGLPVRYTEPHPARDGIPWKRVAFADPLKKAAGIIFQFSDEQLYGSKKDALDSRWGFTRRQIREDVWIRSAELTIVKMKQGGRHVAITDVRFRNEAAAVHEWGGVLVRIQRDPSTVPFLKEGATIVDHANHPSEVELQSIECDHTIVNDGSLEDLHMRVWDLVFALQNTKLLP